VQESFAAADDAGSESELADERLEVLGAAGASVDEESH
jgi:hypothetical protein